MPAFPSSYALPLSTQTLTMIIVLFGVREGREKISESVMHGNVSMHILPFCHFLSFVPCS